MKSFSLIIFFISIILVFSTEVNGATENNKNHCAIKGGQCMNINDCTKKGGNIMKNQALCPNGSATYRCCVPKQNGTTNGTSKKSGTISKNSATNKSGAANNNSATSKSGTTNKSGTTGNNKNHCAIKGGQCMNINDCTKKGGNVMKNQALCPNGSATYRCCVPKQNGTTNSTTKKSGTINKNSATSKSGATNKSGTTGNNKNHCAIKGGQCMNINDCTKKGGNVMKNQALCPNGSATYRCCVPKQKNTTTKKNINHCANRGGQCMNVDTCSKKKGTSLNNQALCPNGSKNYRCCIIPDKNGNTKQCKQNGGQCTTVNQCGIYGGKPINSTAAICPFKKNNICCILPKPGNDTKSHCAKHGGQCTSLSQCEIYGGNPLKNKSICPPGKNNICCDLPKPGNDTKSHCAKHGGQCTSLSQCKIYGGNPLKNKSICPPGKNNICCDLPDPENDTKSQCAKQKGKCMSVDACNEKRGNVLNNTNICPGGENNRCCILPEKRGSGAIDCNGTIDHSTIASAAVAYAYETKEMGHSNDGTALYVAAKKAVMPGDTYFRSCDRGVATAVLWSGADDEFPYGPVDRQENHMKSSEKWILVGDYDNYYNDLQPGDVCLNDDHVILYAGNEEIRKKYPNSDADIVSASLPVTSRGIPARSPGCGDKASYYTNQNYRIYRYIGDYSGNGSKAYTGCASGTSQ